MKLQNDGEDRARSSPNAESFVEGASMIQENLEVRNELHAFKEALNQNTIVSITDRCGIIKYANHQFCKISGYSRDELVGQNIKILNSLHHDRHFFFDLWATISSGRPWRNEIRNRGKHGDIYWVDTTIVPRRNHFGKIDGYVSIRYDITARKAIERELKLEVEKRRNTEELLRELLETIPDGVIAFDARDKLIHFNSAYKSLTEKEVE